MTDDQSTVPSQAPSSLPAPNPLDMLDQILNEAQAKSAEEKQKQEEAEQQRLQAEMDAQRQRDEAAVAEELKDIENLKDSPQYQARVAQLQAEADRTQTQTEQMKGMEIRQLGHTKI